MAMCQAPDLCKIINKASGG